MQSFLIRLFLFFSFLLILLIGLEAIVLDKRYKIFSEENLKAKFDKSAKSNAWINQLPLKPKVVLAGSSSVKYGISCSALSKLSGDSVFYVNIAGPSKDPVETYFILKYLDLSKTNVKAVYYGLDPWIFSKKYYRSRHYLFFLDFNILHGIIYSFEYDRSFFLRRYKELFRFLFTQRNEENPEVKKIPKDYGSEIITSQPVNVKEPVSKYFKSDTYGWSDLQFKYLKKISEYCKQNKVEFYFFVPPKRSDFTHSYKASNLKSHSEFVNHLLSDSITPPVFGRYDILDSLGGALLFKEASHLNAKGQEIYTLMFYDMMQQKNEPLSKSYSWFK